MDTLNFLKFWKNATMNTTPHLVVETDSETDEEDSFFDLELTLHGFDNKENNNINNKTNETPQDQTEKETKGLSSKQELSKTSKSDDNTEVGVTPKTVLSLRKVLPIEPISKPQSPIALLKSAPSFRISMFRKHMPMASQKKTQEPAKPQKKENKVFAVKLNIEEFQCSPALSRDNSTRSFGSRVRNHDTEEPKPERFSKDALQKYLKLIKPLYGMVSKRYNEKVKFKPLYGMVSKRYNEKVKFSGEASIASPLSSPSVSSVPSRKEKQGSFPSGMRVVSKHLGKSKSSSMVAGVVSLANRSDDTLQQHHDGIQSAILHCKSSFNFRDSSVSLSTEGSVHSVRNSFEDDYDGGKV